MLCIFCLYIYCTYYKYNTIKYCVNNEYEFLCMFMYMWYVCACVCTLCMLLSLKMMSLLVHNFITMDDICHNTHTFTVLNSLLCKYEEDD